MTPLQGPPAAQNEPAPSVPGAPESELQRHIAQLRHGIVYTLRKHGWSTLKYMTGTDVHTYAFSVAANAILSFIPSIVLMLTLTRRVFHSRSMYYVVLNLLSDYLPSNKDFVVRNMQALASAHGTQIFSVFMLLFTSTGIFLPLEVALNSVWGIKKNRSYIGNQLISLTLAFACGSLAIGSVALTAHVIEKADYLSGALMTSPQPTVDAGQQTATSRVTGFIDGAQKKLFQQVEHLFMKAVAFVATILIFFLIFWLLPNGKVPWKAVLPAAIITGVATELSKYLYILLLPWLDFQQVYGPFAISVTLIMWAYVSGLLMLGGAYMSAAEHSSKNLAIEPR